MSNSDAIMSPKIKKIPVSLKYEEKDRDSYDLISLVENYSVDLDLNMERVIDMRPSFVDVPGYVYGEYGIAKPHHPTGGSIDVYITLNDMRFADLQIILYHDRNPMKTHYDGVPHWNQEIRLIDTSGQEKLIRGNKIRGIKHVIPDSPYLDMYCLDPNGNQKKIRINRDNYRPIRSRKHRIKTLGLGGHAKSFEYEGSVKEGTTILYSGRPIISAEFYRDILKNFRGKTIHGGFNMTDPIPDGFGEWIKENSSKYGQKLTPRHASHIAAILKAEGYLEHSYIGNLIVLFFKK